MTALASITQLSQDIQSILDHPNDVGHTLSDDSLPAASSAALADLRLRVDSLASLLAGSTPLDTADLSCGMTALWRTLDQRYAALHDSIITHIERIAEADHRARDMIFELVCEFIEAHTHIRTDASATPISLAADKPIPSRRAVFIIARSTFASSSTDLHTRKQQLFTHRLLPFLHAIAVATHPTPTMHRAEAESGSDSDSDGMWKSLQGMMYRHILSGYFGSSNPDATPNVLAMYHLVSSVPILCVDRNRAAILPVFLAFIGEHFDRLVAFAHKSIIDRTTFFNQILPLAQVALAATDALLNKQALEILTRRAEVLYAHESKPPQDAFLSKAHGRRVDPRKANSSTSPSSRVCALRSSRNTTYPDYSLSSWHEYAALWQVILSNYELHLVKHSFNNQLEALIDEHEAWYQHEKRATTTMATETSLPFTPDIFLELLFRRAMIHDNPYVRKHVYHTLLVTLRGRVRWSVELLFDMSIQVSSSSPSSSDPSRCILSIVSDPACQSILPPPALLAQFWLSQLDLVGSATIERANWATRMIRAIATNDNNNATHVALHTNILAEMTGSDHLIAADELLHALYSIARVSTSNISTVARAQLHTSLAGVFLRHMIFTPSVGASAEQMKILLGNIGGVLIHIVPAHMRLDRRNAFHRDICAKLIADEWVDTSVESMMTDLLDEASKSTAHLTLTPDSLRTRAMIIGALTSFLSRDSLRSILRRTLASLSSGCASFVTSVGMELLHDLLRGVEFDRRYERRRDLHRPDTHFHRGMAATQIKPDTTPQTEFIEPSLIADGIQAYLSSSSSNILFGLFRSQFTNFDPVSSSLSGVVAQMRATNTLLFAQVIRLFSVDDDTRRMMIQMLHQCINLLLQNASAAATSTRPLHPCIESIILHSTHSILSSMYESRQFSLDDVLPLSHALGLLEYLASARSTLEERLAPKSIYVPPLFNQEMDSTEALKASWTTGAQLARWSLLSTIMRWVALSAADGLIERLTRMDNQATSQTLITHFFMYDDEIMAMMYSILNSLDAASPLAWPKMIHAVNDSMLLLYRFESAAESLLRSGGHHSIPPSLQAVLPKWIASSSSASHMWSDILHRVPKSFDEIATTRNLTSQAGDAYEERFIRLAQWYDIPPIPLTPPVDDEIDHAIPHIHQSMVELLLHPGLCAADVQLARTNLAAVLHIARKRGMRTLLYAAAIKLVETCSTNTVLGLAFIPELSLLLTLDRRDANAASSGVGEAHLPVAVSIEQLVRVLILSLFEHTTRVAGGPRTQQADDAYRFITHAMHYFVQMNFSHDEYAVDQCGGESIDPDGATSSAGASASSSAASDVVHSKQSTAQRALTAVWHALCTMATLTIRPHHCIPSQDWTTAVEADETIDTIIPKPKQKRPTKAQHKAAARGGDSAPASTMSAFSAVSPMPLDFPLLHFLHHHTLLLLISPSLPSGLRHLIEIFLINFFVRNLCEEDSTGPTVVEKVIMPYLDRTVYKQNVICSLLVITGFVASKLVRLDWLAVQHGDSPRFASLVESLFSRLHVWSQSPLGQVRTVASYFFFHIFLEKFHSYLFTSSGRTILPKGCQIQCGLAAEPMTNEVIKIETEPVDITQLTVEAQQDVLFTHAYLPIFLFLYRSPQLAALRARQDGFFRAFRPFERTSVQGLIQYAHTYTAAPAASSDSLDSNFSPAPVVSSSVLVRVGFDLPSEDLLQHVRAVTSDWLEAMREEREFAYYADRTTEETKQEAMAWRQNGQADETHAPLSESATSPASPNFQQKIAPLRNLLIESGGAVDAIDTAAASGVGSSASAPSVSLQTRLPAGKHLILCASLVSKPVNLGGLCRTAEIMSTSLVLGDERILKDSTFTNVSSTAHLWADISIVPRGELASWLTHMKSTGYTVVGLEQTVHSTPLQAARFDDKVIILLGDEKQGIPAGILALLDECIVIPQFGLIRSLNVHVSGGIIIWEYIKQCINQQQHMQRQQSLP